MKKFFLKLFLAAFPPLALLAFPVVVLYLGGEFTPPAQVLQKQESGATWLYAPAYADFELYYRMQGVIDHNPDVLVLGNSRTLDIRREFFNSGTSFYNAGLLSKGIQNFRIILPKIHPKVMIMALEQSQFNYYLLDFDGYYNIEPKLAQPKPLDYLLNVTIRSWPLVYRDYFSGKFTINQLLTARKQGSKIGVLSIMQNEGFREDGSYRNGRYVDHPHEAKNYDYNFQSTFGLIAQKSGYFRVSNGEVSKQALDETDALLKEAKAEGIYVIAYMPPYAPTVYQKLKSDPNYNYIFNVEAKARPIFNKYGFELYNFSDPASFGGTDGEFFDGYHPGEKTYLRFFIDMAKKSPVLSKLTNVPVLEKALNTSANDYDVFGK